VLGRDFSAGYLDESAAETVLDALNKRNLLSHTYDEVVAEEAVNLITGSYAPVLQYKHHRQLTGLCASASVLLV
jgi:hypothetical protein